MLTAQIIKDRVDQFVESEIRVYPCEHLRASNVGHVCTRYLWLLMHHWEDQEAHDKGLQSIYDLGNAIEQYTIDTLKKSGLEVITPTERSWRFEVKGGVITGREDIRVKDPDDGQFYPAEIKGLSPYEWQRLNSVEDFFASRKHYVRAYPAQLLIYMFHFNKERAFFVLTNKLTGEIKIIDVAFDFDRAEALLAKAEAIYAADSPDMLPACDDPNACAECSMRYHCHAEINKSDVDIDDGEIEALIDRRAELSAAKKEYDDADAEIKRLVNGRQKVFCGKYVCETTSYERKPYEVKGGIVNKLTITKL